jgi:hypothetical protein
VCDSHSLLTNDGFVERTDERGFLIAKNCERRSDIGDLLKEEGRGVHLVLICDSKLIT